MTPDTSLTKIQSKTTKAKRGQSGQRGFDPVSYTIRRATGKKLDLNETARALDRLSAKKSKMKCSTVQDKTKDDLSACNHEVRESRQPATLELAVTDGPKDLDNAHVLTEDFVDEGEGRQPATRKSRSDNDNTGEVSRRSANK